MTRLNAALERGRTAAVRICYIMAFTMIGLGIATPMLTSSTLEADGGAGGIAPFLALSAAALWLIHYLRRKEDHLAWWANLTAGVSLVFSAYYWLAADSEAHPYSSEFLSGLALIVVVLLGMSAFMLLIITWVLFSQSNSKD